MTNGDRIRSMTDEELADILPTADCYNCPIQKFTDHDCHKCALNWLRKEDSTDEA